MSVWLFFILKHKMLFVFIMRKLNENMSGNLYLNRLFGKNLFDINNNFYVSEQ